MSLRGELREVIFGGNMEATMAFLKECGLIASQKNCPQKGENQFL
jgi:hypothetical protein